MNVLIVISGHLLSCPRAVKFADALSNAGNAVQVLGVSVLPDLAAADAALAATRAWTYEAVRPASDLTTRIIQTLARKLCQVGFRSRRLLGASEACLARPLVQALRHQSVDLLVLSNLPAFAAALRAPPGQLIARSVHVDLEDDHVAMLPDEPNQQGERSRRQALIARTLRQADVCTGASPLMCADLQARYDTPVHCVLNVFDPVPVSTTDPEPALIWQSQTIGPDRGLEAFIRVLKHVPNPPRLMLRGMLMPGFKPALAAAVSAAGLPASHVQFAPLCPPHELLLQTRGFRAGLAIEVATEQNRQHCLTNKLFEYLAAGVPVILSRTPAHQAILSELGEAAVMLDLEDPASAGKILAAWLAESARTQANAAHELARERFNWARASAEYLALLSAVTKPN